MRSTVVSGFEALKDRAREVSVRALLNRKFERFGRILTLEIDSRMHTLSAEFELKGEATPIVIRAGGYEFLEEDGSTHIVLRDLQASREWISRLLEECVAGRKLRVPKAVKLGL
jgi:hypothetical protein